MLRWSVFALCLSQKMRIARSWSDLKHQAETTSKGQRHPDQKKEK